VTKKELVSRVAAKSNLSHKDAAAAVDALLESVSEAMKEGDEVAFTGFGKFSTRNQPATFSQTADELREGAAELERGHEAFLQNIERSQQTLKDIAGK
jgi:nucleoid DNA-binding protein